MKKAKTAVLEKNPGRLFLLTEEVQQHNRRVAHHPKHRGETGVVLQTNLKRAPAAERGKQQVQAGKRRDEGCRHPARKQPEAQIEMVIGKQRCIAQRDGEYRRRDDRMEPEQRRDDHEREHQRNQQQDVRNVQRIEQGNDPFVGAVVQERRAECAGDDEQRQLIAHAGNARIEERPVIANELLACREEQRPEERHDDGDKRNDCQDGQAGHFLADHDNRRDQADDPGEFCNLLLCAVQFQRVRQRRIPWNRLSRSAFEQIAASHDEECQHDADRKQLQPRNIEIRQYQADRDEIR